VRCGGKKEQRKKDGLDCNLGAMQFGSLLRNNRAVQWKKKKKNRGRKMD